MKIMAVNNTRQFVLPVCVLKLATSDEVDYKSAELAGTCFLIGRRGYALTAAHVIRQIGSDGRVFYPDPEGWDACPIIASEIHPTEDIGILKIDLPEEVISPVLYAEDEPIPGREYNMWAYPEVIAKEVEHHGPPEGGLPFNPSPVYFRGYIRRKLNYSPNPNLSIYVGSRFYEISEIGGACCSGAPLTTVAEIPGAFAIYIGEAQAERKCAYAANLTKVLDWAPNVLGKPLRYEVIGPSRGAVVSFD